MSITLEELEEIVMLESGEYLLQEMSNLSLTPSKFWIMVRSVLRTYDRWRPFVFRNNVPVSGGRYEYHEDIDQGIPSWISAVVPVTSANVMDVYALMTRRVIGEYSFLEIPRGFTWRYESPYLYVGEDGNMDVLEVHNHKYTLVEDSTGTLTNVTLSTIDEGVDQQFIQLLVARFLMTLGRSRRAFTLNDLPITADADQLVSEGQELWDKTMEKLEESDKWWLALGEGTGV